MGYYDDTLPQEAEPDPVDEFFSKMDYEGGFYGSLEYGIRTNDFVLPKEMTQEFDELRELWIELDDMREQFEAKWNPAR